MSLQPRCISHLISPRVLTEGEGVSVLRIVGSLEQRALDPFLIIDHFEAQKPCGYPDHPHRGHSVLSYNLEGTLLYEDSLGQSGALSEGAVQFITAGRGYIHAAMPGTDLTEGLTIWINLQSSLRMCEPSCQTKPASQVPKVTENGALITIIAGTYKETHSEIRTNSPICVLDVQLLSEKVFRYAVENGWNCILYVVTGLVRVGEVEIESNMAGVFRTEGSEIEIEAVMETKMILFMGKMLGEETMRRGPFVMRSKTEILDAMMDFTEGKNGFESKHWKSSIGNS
jgi:quercetin 2,3-dioxygenase